MKTRIIFLFSLLVSTSAFAQIEYAKGDTLPATQPNRLRDGASAAGRRGQKASTGNFRIYAFYDEVTAATGGAVTSVNGLAGPTVTLTTNNVAESVNLYYTNARARLALSATGPVAYNNSTGVISMPAATNSADGYLTAADRTSFSAKEPAITAGTTAQYLRGDKSLATLSTSVVPEGTNLYYTDARVTAITLPTTTVAAYSNISGVSLPASGTVKLVEVTTDSQYGETSTLYVLRPNGKFRKIILGPDEN